MTSASAHVSCHRVGQDSQGTHQWPVAQVALSSSRRAQGQLRAGCPGASARTTPGKRPRLLPLCQDHAVSHDTALVKGLCPPCPSAQPAPRQGPGCCSQMAEPRSHPAPSSGKVGGWRSCLLSVVFIHQGKLGPKPGVSYSIGWGAAWRHWAASTAGSALIINILWKQQPARRCNWCWYQKTEYKRMGKKCTKWWSADDLCGGLWVMFCFQAFLWQSYIFPCKLEKKMRVYCFKDSLK